MWLLNKDEEITSKLTLISAVHTEVINAENTLTFECVEVVQKMDRVIYRDDLNKYHEFVIQDVVESRDSNIVYAEHSAYEMHGDFVEDKRPTGTAKTHLESILGNVRWKLGTVDGTTSLKGSYYRQSVYKSINDMCALFNVYREFEIVVKDDKVTDRLIHIKTELGFDEGKRFVYSKDLQGVSRNVLMGDVITALYGFGKGEEIGDGYGRRINFSTLEKVDSPIGQKYVTDEPARLEWGRNSTTGKQHVFTSYEFDDIEDVEELYEATKAKLQELKVPRINYSADVILLADKHENVGVGDTVAIIDKDFRGRELRLKGKVFKIERDLIDGTKSVVELGNYIDDLSDANAKLNQFVNDFRDKTGVWDRSNVFDEDGALDSSFIKNILEGWNNQMNGTSGFVYGNEGEGLITYDRAIDDNPTMAIQIVGGGWRIANSKKSNGDWDWRTLGTGDGIYGDQIIANTITVNQLSPDVGTDLDISSNTSVKIAVENYNSRILIPYLNGSHLFNNDGVGQLSYPGWIFEQTGLLTSTRTFSSKRTFTRSKKAPTFWQRPSTSLSPYELQFYLKGLAISSSAHVAPGNVYSFKTKRHKGNARFKVHLREYRVRNSTYDKNYTQRTILDATTFKPYEEVVIADLALNTVEVRLVFETLSDDEFALSESQFVQGLPGKFIHTNDDEVYYSKAKLDVMADKIVLSVDGAGRLVQGELGINARGSYFKLKADNIDLTGYITATDLAGAGSTIINGSNITTGIINADLITAGTINGSNVNVINLNASSITSGTISADRIKGGSISGTDVNITNLSATNITTGEFNAGLITVGTLSADRISGGTIDATRVNITNLNFDNAVGTNVQLTGYVNMISGKIGGWLVDSLGIKQESPSWNSRVVASKFLNSTGGGLDMSATTQFVLRRSGPGTVLNVEMDIYPTSNQNLGSTGSGKRFTRIHLLNQPDVSSDRRTKSDIQEIDPSLVKLIGENVKPRQYRTIHDDKLHFGYIAQDVENALALYVKLKGGSVEDYAVLSNDSEYMSLLYGEIAVIMDAYKRNKLTELESLLKLT